jgi:hypothetical protein
LIRSETPPNAGRWAAALVALVVLCFAVPASAHDLPIERSLVLQVHSSHAELLLVYSEPPGPRTERLLALYDTNENGKIDGVEGTLAKRPMLRRAFLGLNLSFPHVTTAKKEPQIRYRRDRAGGLAVAIYQRIDFINATDVLDVVVKLGSTRGIPKLELVIEVADRWAFTELETDELEVELPAGSEKTFHLRRDAGPISKAVPDRDWQPPEQTRPH